MALDGKARGQLSKELRTSQRLDLETADDRRVRGEQRRDLRANGGFASQQRGRQRQGG